MKALQFIDSFKKNSNIFFSGIFICFLAACGNNTSIENEAKEVEHIEITRFEQDLILNDTTLVNDAHFTKIAKKYNEFYFGFCENTLGLLPQTNDPFYAKSLVGFIKYPSILALKHEVDSAYPNLNKIED